MLTEPHDADETFGVRKFNEKDLDAVININSRCLPEHYSPEFFLDLSRSYPETFIVAENTHTVVGYIMCRIETGFSEISRLRFARKGHIVSIAVIPEFRRRGLALALVASSIQGMHSYGCTETYLEVRESNESAIALYEKMGYKFLRKIHGYYFDGETAYVLGTKIPLHEDPRKLLDGNTKIMNLLGKDRD